MKDRTKINANDLAQSIENILLNKNISYDDKIYAKKRINDLIGLTNGKDAMAYVFLGKINSLLNKYEEAINNFNQAIILDPCLSYSYYGLFDVYMITNQHEQALEQIVLYQLNSGRDCSVYISLLNKYLYDIRIPIKTKDNLFGLTKMYNPILVNYNLMIDAINYQNYEKAIKHAKVCIKLIKINDYHIEIDYLQNLLIKIRIKELQRGFINGINYGASYYYLLKMIELQPDDLNTLILLIEHSFLLFDCNTAENCIIRAQQLNKDFNKRLEYLSSKLDYINNMIKPSQFDLKSVLAINRNNRIIKEEAAHGNIEVSVNYGCHVFNTTGDPDYLYEVAKVMYNNGCYQISSELFERYISLGVMNLKSAYCYLYFIYSKLGIENKAHYYAALALELSSFIDIKIELEDYEQLLLLYASNFSDQSMFEIEKKILNNDVIRKNKVKTYK